MGSSQTVTYRSSVAGSVDAVATLRGPHAFGAYRLADRDMASGSLLGSSSIQIRIKATGAIENIYCADAGISLIRTFLLKHWDEKTGMKLDPEPGHYFLYPEHQEHKYMLSCSVHASERVFVSSMPLSAVYYSIEYTNDAEESQHIGTFAFCDLASDIDEAVTIEYDDSLRALIAYGKNDRHMARIVGADRPPVDYEVSIDRAMTVTPRYPGPLSRRTDASGRPAMGVLHYSSILAPGDSTSISFRMCVSAQGTDNVKSTFRSSRTPQRALTETQEHYRAKLSHTVVMTPNVEINRGVLWAKANMERVMLETRLGCSFTNDPMKSNNCVARDTAWFCAGADYFNPEFSQKCLMQFVKRQERSGLIPEYFDMLDGRTEDYGLNINDDTPLIVWSAWHHYQLTGDGALLEDAYPALVKACRYIATQRNADGLIWCTSKETGPRGITGWRNVIPNYRLSGAVTEINAECYAAFRCMAALAKVRDDEHTWSTYDDLAGQLKYAINTYLLNPGNGLYYLNIDVDGTPRSDITADLILPVVFGVAEPQTTASILCRLSYRDFWTEGGMRTIPHDAVDYTPDGASGCLGGVWNGVTFWYAKAAAEHLPDFAEEALTNGFENYARNPRRNNTVPGQFSEWLHGQTLVNGGMQLSPWFPPRYIWAVVEGTLGFDIAGTLARITPHLPSRWSWSGVRNAPYRGKRLTWFCARIPDLHFWASCEIETDTSHEVLAEDISDDVLCSGDDAIVAALRNGPRVNALVGNASDRAITTAIHFRGVHGPFSGRRYDSMSKGWSRLDTIAERELKNGVTLVLEPRGFQVFELTAAS